MPNLRMKSINTLSNIVSFIETGMKTAWDAG